MDALVWMGGGVIVLLCCVVLFKNNKNIKVIRQRETEPPHTPVQKTAIEPDKSQRSMASQENLAVGASGASLASVARTQSSATSRRSTSIQKTPQLNRLHALLAEASAQGLQQQTRQEADRFYETVFSASLPLGDAIQLSEQHQDTALAQKEKENLLSSATEPLGDWETDLFAALESPSTTSHRTAPKGPRPQLWALEDKKAFAIGESDAHESAFPQPSHPVSQAGDWWQSRDPRFDQRQSHTDVQSPAWSALVVDDSRVAREKVRKLLVLMGAEVREAKDGQDAWNQLEHWIPNLIISDIEMPHMDGVVLARKIKSNLRLASTPVMLMTAHLNTRLQDVAQANIDGFLPKPFADESLREQATFLLTQPRREMA